MNQMLLHIQFAEACGDHSLRVGFGDGTEKVVDVSPLLCGEVFKPLLEPAYFAQVRVDPICRTVVWPNGADLAPEALYALEVQHEHV
jgi:hypothetical protein